jgi:hypothetical protein
MATKNYTSHCSASWPQAVSLNAASKHHYSPETKEENMHELGSRSGYAHGQITGKENVSDVHLNASTSNK